MSVTQALDEVHQRLRQRLGQRVGTVSYAASSLAPPWGPASLVASRAMVAFQECERGWIIGEATQTISFDGGVVVPLELRRGVAIDKPESSTFSRDLLAALRSSNLSLGIPQEDTLGTVTGDTVDMTLSAAVRDADAYHFVPAAYGFLDRYEQGDLGLPLTDVTTTILGAQPATRDGVAFQVFESGALVFNPQAIEPDRYRVIAVVGPFSDEWVNGWSTAGYGLPVCGRLDVKQSFNGQEVTATVQSFENGYIMQLPDGRVRGSLRGSLLKPKSRGSTYDYELKLLDMKVVEESGNNGLIFINLKDQVRLSIAYEFDTGRTERTSFTEYEFDGDNGETYAIDRVIYDGPLPLLAQLTNFGIEEDNDAQATTVLNKFRRVFRETSTVPTFGDVFPDATGIPSEVGAAVIAAGAIAGAIYGDAVIPDAPAAFYRTEGGSLVATGTSTVGGGLVGGIYGAVIAAVIAALLSVISIGLGNWEPPDPLMVAGMLLFGPDLVRAIEGGELPPQRTATFKVFGDYDMAITNSFSRDGGRLIQTIDFDVDDGWSEYRLRFAHDLPNA